MWRFVRGAQGTTRQGPDATNPPHYPADARAGSADGAHRPAKRATRDFTIAPWRCAGRCGRQPSMRAQGRIDAAFA
ncbi:hypothetical protein D9X30_0162 [Cupriavidus sp. U2]|nr:hypothetical protein D9X30_0162 [Cupriavidus sp. U2]